MKRSKSKVLRECYDKEWQKQFISPIPPHLTPEEKERWEKELEWERQEYERRKAQGFYPHQD
tara:strand:- start:878 stop:1063 length:186 start_codon:yes stop_codon:yes gene_type:complete